MGGSRARSLPTGTLTFLFSDIEGSTRLARALGDRWSALLERHQRVLREAFGRHAGIEVTTEGDSFFVVFGSAPAAVAAAADAQRALAAETWPEDAVVRVRMGLHTGEATLGGDNYVGLDVHRAARVAAAGHGDQVLLSAATTALVSRRLPEGVALKDLGEQTLKDLPEPERISQLVVPALPADFPPLRTVAPTNLPPERTSFVGRAREVEEIATLLGSARIVTLTGPGGTGKTRLALRVGGQLRDRFPDGVFFVALEPLREPQLFTSAVARSLGVREPPDRPLGDAVADHLRERELLLLLDNFEQLMGAARQVGELLAGAPRVRVLVTSREALHIAGEQEYPVPPMRVPDPRDLPEVERLSQYEAVALFIARARSVRPDFAVTDENAPAVAEISARLEGLPLAIELAAARVKLLGPDAILARLGSRLDLLSSGAVDLTERQRTLRGAIGWSFDLLNEAERRFFERFSVFAGGAEIEAIEEVAGGDAGGDPFGLLSELVDKSLVRTAATDGEPRFEMLETIREYAAERLTERNEAEEIARRHAAYYLALAERAEPELTGAAQITWLDRCERELDNFRQALRWSIERDEGETGLRLGGALWRFWHQRSHLAEGHDWLARVLALPSAAPRTAARVKGLDGFGGVAYWRADYGTARSAYAEALAIARELGDRRAVADELFNIRYLDYRDGDFEAVERASEEALAIYRELGDRAGVAKAADFVALGHFRNGRYQEARPLLEETSAILSDLGMRFLAADSRALLGLVLSRQGDYGSGRRVLQESMHVFSSVGNLPSLAAIFDLLATVHFENGEVERALRLIGAADGIREREGGGLSSLEILHLEHPRTRALEVLPREKIDQLYSEGRAMTLEQGLAYGMEAPADQ